MALLDRAAQRLLERVRLRVRRDVASTEQGGQRSHLRASGLEFAGHREYVPGDDARQIDWKAFARNRSLTVRTFETERDARVYVLVDVSRSMTRGAPPKLELARQIAAAFGYLGMSQVDRVQVIPFADALDTTAPLLRRKDQYPDLEKFLRGLDARGTTTFADTARTFVERFTTRGLVVIVSDLMEASDWSDSVRLVARAGHQLCLVRVRCDEDDAPAFRGEIELTDAETGEMVRVAMTKGLLEAYREEVTAHVDRTRDACRRVGARMVDAPVELAFEQLLRRVLAPAVEQT
jgi:uncharacterized protein (DUF58 family)